MTDLLVVFVTIGNEVDAGRIARKILEDRLAACVNIVSGVHSFYRWEGTIEGGNEILLIIKTSRELLEELKRTINLIHPYDVPELIALGVEDGLEDYIGWALGELRISDSGEGDKGETGEF
jgi:periplasmic divalent cation tolerance protein